MNGTLDPKAGEITITLNDEDEITLRPTPRAGITISRQYGGYRKARELIVDENFDAAVFIIRVGSNMPDKEARKLEEKVWRNGLDTDLLLPIMKYVAILNNGGRPLPLNIDADYEIVEDNTNRDRIEDQRELGKRLSLEEWYTQLYKYATGWLGYTPEVALDSNVSHLELALEGKLDFLRKTNPWGSDKDETLSDEKLDPDQVAKKMQIWALGMSGKKPDPNRERGKKEGIVLPEGMSMPVRVRSGDK